MQDYFPLKLALGDQFCNRAKERELLKHNILKARHSVLVSPRRYGKSSLVHKVAKEIKKPFVTIDLFLAHDDKAVTKRILTGIANVVSQIIPAREKFLDFIQGIFRNFKVTLAAKHFSIETSYTAGMFDPVDQIYTALCGLAKLSKEKQKKVIFFIDEFQDIANAQNSKAIQGAIRHVAQETSDVVFIFSGSNRHLLLELFDDKSMPLYMLCEKIQLERMSSNDYWQYLQDAAKSKWNKQLPKTVFNRIINYTELHPFYVNLLCDRVWRNKTLPNVDIVTNAWLECYEIEERRLIAELEKLTNNQQIVLKALAINPITEITGQRFLHLVPIAYSSVRQSVRSLYEKDMLYIVKKQDEAIPSLKLNQYRVLDPLLAFALRRYA
ncbi:MAG: AAA family ATPase [Pseudomonadota bacterium]